MDDIDQQVTLLKTIADATRLRILRLLAQHPRTGSELVAELGLTPPTISHHLHRLRDVGIVQAKADAQRRIWSIDPTQLGAASTSQPAAPADAEADHPAPAQGADDQLAAPSPHFDGERLRALPAPGTARAAVLRELQRRFEPGHSYQEREVNAILARAHSDVATLRRELVGHRYLSRAGFVYQVNQTPTEPDHDEADATQHDQAPEQPVAAAPAEPGQGWLEAIVRGAVSGAS